MVKQQIFSYLLIVLALFGIFFLYSNKKAEPITINNLKCPEDYKTDDEMNYALQVFSDDFYSKNPNENIVEWSKARKEFYASHNCTETLQAIEDYKNGKVRSDVKRAINEQFEYEMSSQNGF